MSIRAGLSAFLLLLAASGCAQPIAAPASPSVAFSTASSNQSTCVADRPCRMTGTITVVHRTGTYSWAALAKGDTCMALLLPDAVYRDSRRWNGKRVSLSGTALARGPASPPEILQIQIRDRWLSPLVCGDNQLALYVDDISSVR